MVSVDELISISEVTKKLYYKLYNYELNKKKNYAYYRKTLDNLKLTINYERSIYSKISDEDIDELIYEVENLTSETDYDFENFDIYDRVFDRLQQRKYELCDLQTAYPSYIGIPLDLGNSINIVKLDYETLYYEIVNAAIDYMTIKDIENDKCLADSIRLFYKYKLAYESNSVETTMLNYNFDIDKIQYNKYIEYVDNFKNKQFFDDISYNSIVDIICTNIDNLLTLTEDSFDSEEEYKFNYMYLVHVIDVSMKLLNSEKLKYVRGSLTGKFLSMNSDIPLLTLQLFDENIKYRENIENAKKLVN